MFDIDPSLSSCSLIFPLMVQKCFFGCEPRGHWRRSCVRVESDLYPSIVFTHGGSSGLGTLFCSRSRGVFLSCRSLLDDDDDGDDEHGILIFHVFLNFTYHQKCFVALSKDTAENKN